MQAGRVIERDVIAIAEQLLLTVNQRTQIAMYSAGFGSGYIKNDLTGVANYVWYAFIDRGRYASGQADT